MRLVAEHQLENKKILIQYFLGMTIIIPKREIYDTLDK